MNPFIQKFVLYFSFANIIYVMLALNADSSLAQTNTIDAKTLTQVVPVSHLSSREFIISISILAFGVLTVIAAYILLHHAKVDPQHVIQILALVMIVTGILFLIAAGYNADDIAPALGLLGTIAGYLLGRAERINLPSNQQDKN